MNFFKALMVSIVWLLSFHAYAGIFEVNPISNERSEVYEQDIRKRMVYFHDLGGRFEGYQGYSLAMHKNRMISLAPFKSLYGEDISLPSVELQQSIFAQLPHWPLGVGTELSGVYFGLTGKDRSQVFRLCLVDKGTGEVLDPSVVLRNDPKRELTLKWKRIPEDEKKDVLVIRLFNFGRGGKLAYYKYKSGDWEVTPMVALDPSDREFAPFLPKADTPPPFRIVALYDEELKAWKWGSYTIPAFTYENKPWQLKPNSVVPGYFFGLDNEDIKDKYFVLRDGTWQVDPEANKAHLYSILGDELQEDEEGQWHPRFIDGVSPQARYDRFIDDLIASSGLKNPYQTSVQPGTWIELISGFWWRIPPPGSSEGHRFSFFHKHPPVD